MSLDSENITSDNGAEEDEEDDDDDNQDEDEGEEEEADPTPKPQKKSQSQRNQISSHLKLRRKRKSTKGSKGKKKKEIKRRKPKWTLDENNALVHNISPQFEVLTGKFRCGTGGCEARDKARKLVTEKKYFNPSKHNI